MRWAARSVIPTLSAMSRSRAFGSRWSVSRTCVWFERNRHVLWLSPMFDIRLRKRVFFVVLLDTCQFKRDFEGMVHDERFPLVPPDNRGSLPSTECGVDRS